MTSDKVLPLPIIDGIRDGVLDPAAHPRGTTMHIPDVGQRTGDDIVIFWDATSLEGTFMENVRIDGSLAGRPFPVHIPPETIWACSRAYGQVRVRYKLVHAGDSLDSDTLTFTVRKPGFAADAPAQPLQGDKWTAPLPPVPWRVRIAWPLRLRR